MAQKTTLRKKPWMNAFVQTFAYHVRMAKEPKVGDIRISVYSGSKAGHEVEYNPAQTSWKPVLAWSIDRRSYVAWKLMR